MRLIDAEKCPCKGCSITYCHENCKKYYAWLNGCDYDVEAVVEKIKKSETGNDGMIVLDGKEPMIWKSKAIEIVRGKE